MISNRQYGLTPARNIPHFKFGSAPRIRTETVTILSRRHLPIVLVRHNYFKVNSIMKIIRISSTIMIPSAYVNSS